MTRIEQRSEKKRLEAILIKRPSEYTNELKTLSEELDCRSMIDSCLVYGIGFLNSRYKDDYIKSLGMERVKELYNEQLADFEKAIVLVDVGTDGEGVSYNTIIYKDEINQAMLDKLVEYWHTHDTGTTTLREFLKMSIEEYQNLITNDLIKNDIEREDFDI